MRLPLIGVGLIDDPVDPGLLIKPFGEDMGIGEGDLHPLSLTRLAEHGPNAAPGVVGQIALFALSALHPDAFEPFANLSH
jgi:hypothetical protein